MISDVAIVVAGVFVFGMETGLFSILGLVLRSLITDNFIESFNLSKCFNVVCDSPEPICNFIIRDLHRGLLSTPLRVSSPDRRNTLF